MEIVILETLDWNLEHISPIELSRMMLNAFFTEQKVEFNYGWVNGYFEGFIIMALSDPEFLSLNYFEISLATVFAFLDILDIEEYRRQFFIWISSFSTFEIVYLSLIIEKN